MLLFFVKEFEKSSFTKSLWCNSTNHACPNNSQTQLENMDKQKFVECYISNSQYNIWCPIYDFFGQTFELTPPQHFKKGTFYMTEDGHISNCLMNKTIRYMTVFGHIKSALEFIAPSQDLKKAFLIWPKTVIYRIVWWTKQFDIWPSSVI